MELRIRKLVNFDEEIRIEGERALSHLVTVDASVPGRASFNELIAEDMEPVELDRISSP
jgi:hypothetical protein